MDDDLPNGWELATIGDVAETIRGVTYKKENSRRQPEGGLVPILRATNINGKLDFDDLVYVPDKCVSDVQILKLGDIVIAASSGSKAVVGKAARLTDDWQGSFGAFCMAVRPSTAIKSSFLAYFMETPTYRHRVSELSAGVNINNLRREHIEETPFPVPPLPEQDRIVSEIEVLLTDLDAAVAALKRVQANLKRYRASVLKAACEGRLVPTEAELARKEGRSYESGEKLLQRILKERRAKWEADQLAKMHASGQSPKDDDWKKKYKQPALPNTSGLHELPEGWAWATLEQLTSLVTSGSRGWAEYYSERGPLFIRAQDIKTDQLALDEIAHVELPAGSEGTRTRVYRDDVLVTITGANVTKSALVEVELDEAYVSQHVALIRPVNGDIGKYLYSWIVSPAHGRKVLETAAYGAGKPGLNLDHLRSLVVALPPIAEQIRILSELSASTTVAENVASSVEKSNKRASRLRQSILKRAFEGKLVPQDPNDEPASVLLERIRSERVEKAKPIKTNVTQKGAAGISS